MEYKSQKFASKLILVNKFFPSSQICYNRGSHRHKMPLKNHIYLCPDCGHTEDRTVQYFYSPTFILSSEIDSP
ncbi:transposase [Dolichospermum sp. FACHB-1091]|uniref:transposase n=1 Tax=Dolichospermum sp. FACHB-1091 TaxID=2692798 RepID=UPI001F551766|nr:transposase [Dolichospermum sp. FACHB-1091]